MSMQITVTKAYTMNNKIDMDTRLAYLKHMSSLYTMALYVPNMRSTYTGRLYAVNIGDNIKYGLIETILADNTALALSVNIVKRERGHTLEADTDADNHDTYMFIPALNLINNINLKFVADIDDLYSDIGIESLTLRDEALRTNID